MHWSLDDMFTLLRPAAGRSSEGRILHIGELGHAVIYDADARSVSTAPVGNKHVMGVQDPRKWQPLPLPPPLLRDFPTSRIESFTVVDGGRTICASCDGKRTYCLDTASSEWRLAGDWALPFRGRAEYAPELNTWLGFRPDAPNHLCAVDLSGVGADTREASKLQHVWEDFTPPPMEESSIVLNRRFPRYVLRRTKHWGMLSRDLVNLGYGRFCIAKVFTVIQRESIRYDVDDTHDDVFAVLTGVEVLRSGDDEGVLRMVKHKAKRYISTLAIMKELSGCSE
ncbi:hypothetical protein BAE44_0006375 [Dichanthelium oligosanthes]|uniref:Uncharacterized protein n=1 Tax=Dichanthelium oligosanthes TaxID=888268 RepID=A0A1E5W5B0_9POAL|nr:hypothetical protein BAE44_0006375 [Dichanthelium oligosanthes]